MPLSLDTDGAALVQGAFSGDPLHSLRGRLSEVPSSRAGLRNLAFEFPKLKELSCSPSFRKWLPSPELEPVRYLLFDKTPDANWPVAWHQDRTICVQQRIDTPGYGPWTTKNGTPHVEPPVELLENMTTLRLHLDDTPTSNGALRIIPGSHKHGKLTSEENAALVQKQAVDCDCAAGDVLLMKPLVLHSSGRATSPSHRRVIHIEYAMRSMLHRNLDWAE
ncbi:MAG: phytanoyl-CoA dioxygenase family protein [Verrucomicrobiales bacterium]|nr:phytanoyl-CoA dioxygenase family protein [Verrucomicrobiales bacterium]